MKCELLYKKPQRLKEKHGKYNVRLLKIEDYAKQYSEHMDREYYRERTKKDVSLNEKRENIKLVINHAADASLIKTLYKEPRKV